MGDGSRPFDVSTHCVETSFRPTELNTGVYQFSADHVVTGEVEHICWPDVDVLTARTEHSL